VVQSVGHTELIGRALFIDFLLPFEITSILLLVAMIGAVVLAKRTV
jgi:NADH-quinone oxidoreductase subunit J